MIPPLIAVCFGVVLTLATSQSVPGEPPARAAGNSGEGPRKGGIRRLILRTGGTAPPFPTAGPALAGGKTLAGKFGLEVLQEAVQDYEFNITRFAIIGGEVDGTQHPGVGMITFVQDGEHYRCSGTLVAPTVVVLVAVHRSLHAWPSRIGAAVIWPGVAAAFAYAAAVASGLRRLLGWTSTETQLVVALTVTVLGWAVMALFWSRADERQRYRRVFVAAVFVFGGAMVMLWGFFRFYDWKDRREEEKRRDKQ